MEMASFIHGYIFCEGEGGELVFVNRWQKTQFFPRISRLEVRSLEHNESNWRCTDLLGQEVIWSFLHEFLQNIFHHTKRPIFSVGQVCDTLLMHKKW